MRFETQTPLPLPDYWLAEVKAKARSTSAMSVQMNRQAVVDMVDQIEQQRDALKLVAASLQGQSNELAIRVARALGIAYPIRAEYPAPISLTEMKSLMTEKGGGLNLAAGASGGVR